MSKEFDVREAARALARALFTDDAPNAPSETPAIESALCEVYAAGLERAAEHIDEHGVGRDDDPHDVCKDMRDEIRSLATQARKEGR